MGSMAKLLINNDQAPDEAENQSAQAPQAPGSPAPQQPITPLELYQAHQLRGGRDTGGFRPGGSSFSAFKGAGIKGADHNDARLNAASAWHKMPHGDQIDWLSANGAPPDMIAEHTKKAPAAPALPASVLAMPNQPDVNGGRPGKNVMQRFAAMGAADASRNAAVKQAVTAAHAAQVVNPAATVDAARAVRDAALAKDGITDLGGGNKVMSNKYGSGFATQLSPDQMKTRKPGVIRDEKGTVDVGKMMANKGGNGPVPYVPPTPGTPFANSPTAGETRPEVQQQIATGIASLMPGASKRLEADRNREVKSYAAQQVATYGPNIGKQIDTFASESQPGFTGPFTPSGLAGKANAKPVVAANSTKPMQTLAEAAGFTKAEGNSYGDWNDGTQNLRPASQIPVKEAMKKTVAGYNVAPSFTAEEAKQADAKKQQGAKDLDSARIEQWNNHLKQIQDYAGSIGVDPSKLHEYGLSGGAAEGGGGMMPTPELSRVWQNFKPNGIAFKQHGTGRDVTWDELIQDVYGRATSRKS